MLSLQDIQSAKAFETFSAKISNYYCAICCILLYENDTKKVPCPIPINTIPCTTWGLPPIVDKNDQVIICKHHPSHTEPSTWISPIIFPGHIPLIIKDLSYLELACLSPIKIMSQITRSLSSQAYHLGHFKNSGDIWMDYNYLFTGLINHGTLGLFYNDHDKNCTYTHQ